MCLIYHNLRLNFYENKPYRILSNMKCHPFWVQNQCLREIRLNDYFVTLRVDQRF